MAAEDDQSKPTPPKPRRKRSVTIDLPPGEAREEAAANAEPTPIPVTLADGDERTEAAVGGAGPRVGRDDDIGRAPAGPTGGWAMLAGAIMGALVVLIGGYLLMFTDLLPPPSGDAADTAEAALAEVQRLDAELQSLRQAVADAPPPDLTPLSDRIAELETIADGLTDLGGRIDALAADMANATAARQSIAADVATLRQEVVAAAAAAGDPQAAAQLGDNITALGERIAALENGGPSEELLAIQNALAALEAEVADLTARTDTLAVNAEERDRAAGAARVLAVNNLRFAAERGEPFISELAVLAELGVAPDALAELQAMAATGVPSASALAAEFDEVGFAILDATNDAAPEAGFWERLFDNARGVVTVRPTVPIEGDTPAAIVSRMQAAIDAGDFETALSERAALPEAGLTVSAEWAAAVEARIALQSALATLTTAVQQQMGG